MPLVPSGSQEQSPGGIAVVYLWGIQALRPVQLSGKAVTEAATCICEGKYLQVAARSAGLEASGGEKDVGRDLVRLGLTWQDQRGATSHLRTGLAFAQNYGHNPLAPRTSLLFLLHRIPVLVSTVIQQTSPKMMVIGL